MAIATLQSSNPVGKKADSEAKLPGVMTWQQLSEASSQGTRLELDSKAALLADDQLAAKTTATLSSRHYCSQLPTSYAEDCCQQLACW